MIYLDYNSTHPIDQKIYQHNLNIYFNNWGNPSGLSAFAQNSSALIYEVRQSIAKLFGVTDKSIVFTTSGTEAIQSLCYQVASNILQQKNQLRILMSPFEHPAMLNGFHLFKDNLIDIDFIPVLENGQVDIDFILKNIANYDLVSLMLAQNETGVIQPLDRIIKERNKIFAEDKKYIPVISDTIQAIGKMNFDYSKLDGFTVAGHKIGAGIGAACYYINQNIFPDNFPIFKGGNQENSKRAGTENILAILNLGACLKQNLIFTDTNLKILRDDLEVRISQLSCYAGIAGAKSSRLTNTSYILLKDIQLDFLLMFLDDNTVTISNGTSCKSGSRSPSTTLLEMGYSPLQAENRIRISMGKYTTKEEIDKFIKLLKVYQSS